MISYNIYSENVYILTLGLKLKSPIQNISGASRAQLTPPPHRCAWTHIMLVCDVTSVFIMNEFPNIFSDVTKIEVELEIVQS